MHHPLSHLHCHLLQPFIFFQTHVSWALFATIWGLPKESQSLAQPRDGPVSHPGSSLSFPFVYGCSSITDPACTDSVCPCSGHPPSLTECFLLKAFSHSSNQLGLLPDFSLLSTLFIDLSLMDAPYVAWYYNYLGLFPTFCLNYNSLYHSEYSICYTLWA